MDKELEKFLKKYKDYCYILNNITEGIALCNKEGNIIFINKGFSDITGYSIEEVLGKNPKILKSDRHQKSYYKEMWVTLNKKLFWKGEIWNRKKNGKTFLENLKIKAFVDENNNIEYYLSIFYEKKLYLNDNNEFDEIDNLTKLPTRSVFLDRLNMNIAQSKQNNTKIAVITLNIDRFKNINNSLGYILGDFVLQKVAVLLRSSLKSEYTVSHFNSDVFAILISNFLEVESLSEELNKLLNLFNEPILIEKNKVYINVSLGVSIFPEDAENSLDLLKNSEIALHYAKKSHFSKYKFFSHNMGKVVGRQIFIENELRSAVSDEQFELYYQPIVNIQTKRIEGAECLIRWNHPKAGVVPPDDFIPLSEKTMIILNIGDWTIQNSFLNLSALDMEIYFSINISGLQFYENNFFDKVDYYLKKYKCNASRIYFELTENCLIKNIDSIIEKMNNIKKMGIQFSIDDFGTGYSSLSYIKKFPLNNLKIDRSFISDVFENEESRLIVKTIVAMAENLNLKIVAEGVETLKQLNFLKKIGVEKIQGYFFSKPLKYKEFLNFLNNFDFEEHIKNAKI